MPSKLTIESLQKALQLLSSHLDRRGTETVRLVVCGGSALIATRLRQRTTKDVDIVALLNADQQLASPDPLPGFLLDAAKQVARDLGLFEDWLNNKPSRTKGGLFQMGLPEGFVDRLTKQTFGPRLEVHFIGRLDQIFLKLYAVVDRQDEENVSDLHALRPTLDELEAAARWTMTHDVSEPFKQSLKQTLKDLGHESVADRL